MTRRAIVGIILSVLGALVCGALVAASDANAAGIVFNQLTATDNNPGTASLATLQSQISATNTDSTTHTATVTVSDSGFTAPTAPPGSLLLQTSISGSVGISGTNGDNLLSFTGSVAGDTLSLSPNVTTSNSTFSDTADLLIASLAAPFAMGEVFDITLGAGATVSFTGTTELTPAAAPLPAALPLFATGLGALGLLGWRRKRKARTTA
jgi:hypothetical protein